MSSIGLNKTLRGIRFRLTLVYSTLFGLFICVFAYILTGHHQQTSQQDLDSALLDYAIEVAREIGDTPFAPAQEVEGKKNKQFPLIEGSTYYVVRSLEGEILSESKDRLFHAPIPYDKRLAHREPYSHRYQDLTSRDQHYRALNLKISNEFNEEVILQVATPSDFLIERKHRLFLINIITIPLLILTSSLASFIVAGNALTPIKTLTDTATNIAASNLSLRVPVIETGDEIEELSKTLNILLERLEKSFVAQEHFVANASHQLNTPLTIIKGELDVLESKARTMSDYQRFHKSLREEVERLIELVKNLLLVSRVEAGQDKFSFKPLRIDELILATIGRLSTKAREKKVILRFNIDEDTSEAHDLEIQGERQLLESLLENILDNAIKYSPEGGIVKVGLSATASKLDVSVADEGPGIGPQELQKILSQRFQRGQGVMMPGTGIGLSIAYKIAQHHNAQISYENLHPKGSLFNISFIK